MCTVLFSYKSNSDWPLLIAANRDEFYTRNTQTLHWWQGDEILGGRDLEQGGTWFGVHRSGKFATLTNHRSFPLRKDTASRGNLVKDFLEGSMSPADYCNMLQEKGSYYNGFNLLFGYADDLWYFSNKGGTAGPVNPGIHGLSNALLNSPWPKVETSKILFESKFKEPQNIDPDTLFAALRNTQKYPDHLLPETGIGLERERALSALFIESEGYGTRASWMMRISAAGNVEVAERSYIPESEAHFSFEMIKNSAEI